MDVEDESHVKPRQHTPRATKKKGKVKVVASGPAHKTPKPDAKERRAKKEKTRVETEPRDFNLRRKIKK